MNYNTAVKNKYKKQRSNEKKRKKFLEDTVSFEQEHLYSDQLVFNAIEYNNKKIYNWIVKNVLVTILENMFATIITLEL